MISKFSDTLKQRNQPTIFGSGQQTRAFVFVGGVARINTTLLFDENEGLFNVCRNTSVSLTELAQIMADIAGINPSPKFQSARAGDIQHSRGDRSKLASIGLTAPKEMETGLKALMESGG